LRKFNQFGFWILIIFFSTGCGIFNSDSNSSPKGDIVFVALQGLDQVGMVNTDTGDIEAIEINFETMDMQMGEMSMGEQTPHFIAIDNANGYWFVTTIMSGFVGRYDLNTNTLIDKVAVGDLPALMVLNSQNKKLYVSRMMPMTGMTGSESTFIQEIDYSNPDSMVIEYEYSIGSPAPHGMGINSIGSEVYTASNTADWFFKINTDTGGIEETPLEEGYSQDKLDPIARLKPIQVLSLEDSLVMITCSGGKWTDGTIEKEIPGLIQLWNTNSMTLIDTLQLSWKSSPWHITASPNSQIIYTTLRGDPDYPGSAGVLAISYEMESLSIFAENYSEKFESLHGIDISSDGESLYVSGMRDGHLHHFKTTDLQLIQSIPLGDLNSFPQPGGIKVK